MYMKESIIFDPPTFDSRFPFRARRVLFGLSQRDLVAQAGISECTLRRLEQGEPIGLPHLRRIAPHLNLSFAQALAMMASLHEDDARETRAPASTGSRGASQPGEES
jgi:transcriptional regulator with XRE-family HTH domain